MGPCCGVAAVRSSCCTVLHVLAGLYSLLLSSAFSPTPHLPPHPLQRLRHRAAVGLAGPVRLGRRLHSAQRVPLLTGVHLPAQPGSLFRQNDSESRR